MFISCAVITQFDGGHKSLFISHSLGEDLIHMQTASISLNSKINFAMRASCSHGILQYRSIIIKIQGETGDHGPDEDKIRVRRIEIWLDWKMLLDLKLVVIDTHIPNLLYKPPYFHSIRLVLCSQKWRLLKKKWLLLPLLIGSDLL